MDYAEFDIENAGGSEPMPKAFVMYQVVYSDDGTFTLNRIRACHMCGSMIPDNTHWMILHTQWHAEISLYRNKVDRLEGIAY